MRNRLMLLAFTTLLVSGLALGATATPDDKDCGDPKHGHGKLMMAPEPHPSDCPEHFMAGMAPEPHPSDCPEH